MRMIAWCVLTLSLLGCHSGPRWCMRDCDTSSHAHFDDQPVIESTPPLSTPPMQIQPSQPPKEGPALTPQPAQKERTPYESSSRSRGWFGSRSTSHASHKKSTSKSRTTHTARRSSTAAPAAKSAAQDESVKQMLAELEKIKREKSALEAKLTEESAKQTQQRLEVEARLALLQEQIRQQSALQQVTYQQQQPMVMSRPIQGYAGPMITSGTPSPSMQMPFSPSTPMCVPQQQQQSIPAWGNSAPTWNVPATPAPQQVEQWPYSPQRR